MARINSTIKMTDKASGPMGMIRQSIKGARQELTQMQGAANKGSNHNFFSGLSGKIIAVNQGIELLKKGIQALRSMTGFMDQLTMNRARIDLINDGLQKTAELQDMIYKAANRSRGSYDAMQKSVAKLGMLAGDAFGSNREIVGFTEMLNKAFVVSGSGPEEISSAMYQLTQAMASGSLQGDELRTIREAAPMVYDAIANYMGKSKGELKELGSEGKITSDIIKAALLNASDEINEQFKKMPITFAQAGNMIKNAWQKGMQGVANNISKAFNSEGFQKFLRIVIAGIERIGSIIGPVISGIMIGLGWIATALEFIAKTIIDYSPLIVAALLTIGTIMLVSFLPTLWAIISGWVIAGTQALIAGAKMAIAWLMALGPIGWIILAIIAVIGIIRLLAGSFEKVGNIIGAIIGGLVAYIYNLFIVNLYNGIVSFVEFFANVFTNPVYSIKKLFVSLLDTVLETAKNVAKVIDKIFGSNLAGKVSGMQSKMYAWLGDKPDNYKVMEKLEQMDITDAASFGSKIGGAAGKALDDTIAKAKNMFGGIGDADKDKYSLDDVYNSGSIDTNVTGGKLDDVNISDEDLKMLKDIATREYMLNYKHITPNVKIEFGDVRETADVGKVRDAIRKMMEEELAELYVVEEA